MNHKQAARGLRAIPVIGCAFTIILLLFHIQPYFGFTASAYAERLW
jgi:hypothetical protein